MKIEFDHALQDTVKIKAIEASGIVEAMIVSDYGLQYKVAYWFEGKRFVEWVYGTEISAA